MEYNIIFQRIFNDIPFIGYYRLEDIPYSGVLCNIISYYFLRSAYSPRRTIALLSSCRAPLTSTFTTRRALCVFLAFGFVCCYFQV